MALRKFGSDIDLNKNQILNPVMQVLSTAPGTPFEGQFYYNSTDQTPYIRISSSWLNLGVQGLSDGDYGDIIVGGSGTTLTIDNDVVTYAKIQNVVGNNVLLGNNSGAGGIVDELTGTEVTALLDVFTDSLKGLVPASGGGTSTFLRADGTFATPAGGFADFTFGADSGVDVTVDSGDLVEVLGDTGITTTITKISTTVSVTVDLDDTTVTPGSYGLAGSVGQFTVDQQGRITAASDVPISITESQISNLGTTVTLNADTDLTGYGWFLDDDNMSANDATKTVSQQSLVAYVTSQIGAVAGGITSIEEYNASTNTPDLDTAPSGISKGDLYVVTVAGTFFSEELQAGDIIISKQDNPTLLTHWIRVNRNIPEIISASETAEGIIELATQTEVNTGTDTERAVTPATLQGKLGVTGSLNSTLRYTQQIGDGASTNIVVTHNIGRQFVTAQIFETASPFAQIECEVEMDSTTQTSFSFNVAPASNEYTVVIVG